MLIFLANVFADRMNRSLRYFLIGPACLRASSRFLWVVALVIAALNPALTARTADSSQTQYAPDADDQYWKAHWLKLGNLRQALSQREMTSNQKLFDITYYDISLKIDPDLRHLSDPELKDSVVTGIVTAAGRAIAAELDTVELDLTTIDIFVDSVLVGGARVDYRHENDLVKIPLPQGSGAPDFSVTIYYHGRPQAFGWGAFSWGEKNGKPTVFTLSEPYYARYWWPCKDHPSDKADSVDIRVTIDSSLIVVSNGRLVSIVDNGDGTKTTHWHESYPIATYLVSLAIADYYAYSDTLRYQGYTMPIDFFLYDPPDSSKLANQAKVKEMIAFYSDIFGLYPFINEKYGHAQFTWGGGMEHQTCTSLGTFGESIIAHELSHQWWGDMITCGSWHDIWLNEGFARNAEALWWEHVGGKPAYHQFMNRLGGTDGPLYVQDTSDIYSLFALTIYDKGGFVLHTLRYVVGDSAFFQILKVWGSSEFKYGSAVTPDFQRVAETVSGVDLDAFFQQWVYGSGRPDFHYAYVPEQTDSGCLIHFCLLQVQTRTSQFKTDIDVRFYFAGDSATFRLSDSLAHQDFALLLSVTPDSCVVDPDNWIRETSERVEYIFQIPYKTLPDVLLGLPYMFRVQAFGGTPPYNWVTYADMLPDGLTFSEDNLISGTPTESGRFYPYISVTDSADPPAMWNATLPLDVKLLHGELDGAPPITLSDLLFLVRYLYKDGSPSDPASLADINCDDAVNMVDLVSLINYLFRRGPLPCATLP
jgi:hypothetical protein